MIDTAVDLRWGGQILLDQAIKVTQMGARRSVSHIGKQNGPLCIGKNEAAGHTSGQRETVVIIGGVVVADLPGQTAEEELLGLGRTEKFCILVIGTGKGGSHQVIAFVVAVTIDPQCVYQQEDGEGEEKNQNHAGCIPRELPAQLFLV